ncbi:organic cation/carnitine transporter 3-like [Vigna unguiculata]|uniref:organic cation/carnitine transporter 3-like n=1 Tax=Vigna unguiculata TaxID=3917 RepID=UPI001015F82A|nr:organic cation/carnitine transporter 3-like [Vigna unguiculata]XP_027909859.1 organic cation/carnitine transporter 3-like [Vigna unguiculata]
MEDSVKDATKSSSVLQQQQKIIVSWDEMIEKGLGNFGWTQFLQCILVSVAMFFDSQQLFIAIYTDDYPTWHCTNHTTTCTSNSGICKLPKTSWAWDGPSSKTIISQFGLECATSFITGLPQSSFFLGCLLGSFLLATLADTSLGRKNMIILSCLSMSVISLIIIFSTNVWIYSALKFLIGFCRSSISTCCLVLLMEKVSTEWRFTVGIIEFVFFTSGYMSLPGVAYANRNSPWKYLYVWISLPALSYSLIAYLFVTESPRWLLMQGRVKEAMEMLKGVHDNAAPEENGVSTTDTYNYLKRVDVSTLNTESCEEKSDLERSEEKKKKRVSFSKPYSSVAVLLRTSWGPKRMVGVMGLGLGIGMVYFGMPLAVGNLNYNIYLAVVLNALMEIPSCVVTYFLGKCGRKLSIFVFSVGSGICCIVCVVIRSEGVKVWVAVASFFCACTAFNVFLIYMVELFPTCVRNTTASLARQAVVFGCVFSPFLIAAGRKNNLFSYGVFGVLIISSTLTLLSLPETRGMPLSDTMDQQEMKEGNFPLSC